MVTYVTRIKIKMQTLQFTYQMCTSAFISDVRGCSHKVFVLYELMRTFYKDYVTPSNRRNTNDITNNRV